MNSKKFYQGRTSIINILRIHLIVPLLMLFMHVSPIIVAKGNQKLSLLTPLKVNWIFESSEIMKLSPATQLESIYLPLKAGHLVSLHAKNGELTWKAEIGGEITSSPLVDETAIYLASTPIVQGNIKNDLFPTGDLRALGIQGGITLWKITLPSPFIGELSANEFSIFGCLGDGSVISVSKKAGQVLWKQKNASPCKLSPILNEGLLFVVGADGSLTALDQESGATTWRYQMKATISSLSTAAKSLYLGSTDNYVYALSAHNGETLWRHRTQGSIQSIVPSPHGLLITSFDNFAYNLSLNKGKRIWKKKLGGRIASPPVVSAEAALFSILSGDECVILELKSGKKLNSIFVDENIKLMASPVISGDTLLVPTRKGLIAFVDKK